MIRDSISTIFPENRFDSRIFSTAAVISTLSCALIIWAPAWPAKIFILALALFAVAKFRIHVIQITILLVAIGTILPDEADVLTNNLFGFMMLLTAYYLGVSFLLGRRRLQYSWFNNTIALTYVGFAMLGLISSGYNFVIGPVAFSEIARYLIYAALAIISFHLIDDIAIVRRIAWVLIGISVSLAIYSYYLAISLGIGRFIASGITILHGTSGALSNAGATASLITNAMPIPLAYLMFGKNEKSKKASLVLFSFLLIIWVLLNCRADYVFLISSFLFLILFHKNRWKFMSGIFIMLAAFIILVNIVPLFNMALRLSAGMTFREDLWRASFRMISQSPLLGNGFGYFDRFKFSYMDPNIGRLAMGTVWQATPHNVLIAKAVEMGIGASLVQLICWLLPIYFVIKNASALRKSKYYFLFLGFGATMIGSEVRCLFDTSGTVVMIIVTAIIFRLPQLIKSHEDRNIIASVQEL